MLFPFSKLKNGNHTYNLDKLEENLNYDVLTVPLIVTL